MLYLCMILHLSYLEMVAIWRGKEKFKCCNMHEHMRRNWESKTLMCRFGWTEGLILNISELKNCFHFSVTGPWLIYAWVKPFSVITLGNFKLKNYFPLRKGSNEFQFIFFFLIFFSGQILICPLKYALYIFCILNLLGMFGWLNICLYRIVIDTCLLFSGCSVLGICYL